MVALGWLVAYACGGETPTDPEPKLKPKTVSSVVVTPTADTLVSLGETGTLAASARASDGSTLSGQTFTWISSDTVVATVSSAGVVTAVANGSVMIRATTAGVTGNATITVAQVVASVDVTPTALTLSAIGAQATITAVPRDAGGSAMSAALSWQSWDPSLAMVDAVGVVTAVENGVARITASVGTVTTDTVLVTVRQVGHVRFTVQPSSTSADSTISPAVVVTIEDSLGNAVTDATDPVALGLVTDLIGVGALLTGAGPVDAVAGVATFPSVHIGFASGGYTLEASAPELTPDTSAAFDITHGAATRLVFSVEPGDAVAGSPMTPAVAVTLEDQFGNIASSATNAITLTVGPSDPSGRTAALSGGGPVNAVDGVTTFPGVSLDKIGAGYTVTASGVGLVSAVSGSFDITSGVASQLAFTVQPSNAGAGVTMSPQVQVTVLDALGNTVTTATDAITLTLATDPSGGTATVTGGGPVNAVNGVATFAGVSLDKAGVGYTVVASAPGLASDVSVPFDIGPAAPSRLRFSVQPSNAVAGAVIVPDVVVQIVDAFGNVVPETDLMFLSIVAATDPSSGSATVSYTPINAVAGVATFSGLSIDVPGVGYQLQAIVDTTGLQNFAAPDTSVAFNITGGVATQLAFTVQPSSTTAGMTVTPQVQVTVQDALGNAITSSSAAITLALDTDPSGGAATLTGGGPVNAVNGVATFAVSLDKTASGYTLAASAAGLAPDTSTAFDITPGAASRLMFTVQPTNTTAGLRLSLLDRNEPSTPIQVTVQDALGNTATSAVGDVVLSIANDPTGGTAVLEGGLQVFIVNGVATFVSVVLKQAAVGYALEATSDGLTQDTSAAFDILPDVPNRTGFAVQPTDAVVNASITPAVEVEIRDRWDNLIPSATHAVSLVLYTDPSGGTATLSGSGPVNAVGGVATFNSLSLDVAAASYRLQSTATGIFRVDSSVAFDIVTSRLRFTVQPSTTSADSTISPAVVVTIEDSLGNTVTDATGPVTLTLATDPTVGAATLLGGGPVNAVSGIATFPNVHVDVASGGYTLEASGPGFAPDTSVAFDVTHGVADRLAFTVQPSTAVAGVTVDPQVQVTVRDAFANAVTTATDAITLALGTDPSGGTATLTGGGPVSAVNGVATFLVSLDVAALGYTLEATATGRTPDTSDPLDITAAAKSRLVFSVQPSDADPGMAMTPAVIVAVADAFGNTVPGETDAITLAFANDPSGGAGTLTGGGSTDAVGTGRRRSLA